MTTQIHDKIAKLFALSQDNANEHEAETAMRMATALMMKYNISEDEIKRSDDKPEVTKGDFYDDDKQWHNYAAWAASLLYNCRKLCYGPRFMFVGRAENVDAAQMTYEFIREQVEALYKVNLPRGMSKKERAEYRRDFKLTCAMRVYARAQQILKDLEANAPEYTGSTALVVVGKRKELEQEIKDFFESLGTVKMKASRAVKVRDSKGSEHGHTAGAQVQLNKRVH